MILNILKIQNPSHVPTLRATSQDVIVFDQELHDFCQSMIETMFASKGVGLAAPQVGRNQNIFVMQSDPEHPDRNQPIILINPFTAIAVGDPYLDQEGCLSVPGFVGDVERFRQVGAVYQDVTGQRQRLVLEGLPARIYQHEFDHLVGTLFIDRAIKLYGQASFTDRARRK